MVMGAGNEIGRGRSKDSQDKDGSTPLKASSGTAGCGRCSFKSVCKACNRLTKSHFQVIHLCLPFSYNSTRLTNDAHSLPILHLSWVFTLNLTLHSFFHCSALQVLTSEDLPNSESGRSRTMKQLVVKIITMTASRSTVG